MSTPKSHHFLPQFYLRRFADYREGLYQFEKTSSSRAIPTKVSKTGCKRDYHTLDWEDEPTDRSSVEKHLSMSENHQEQMLTSLSKDPVVIENLRHELIAFVTLMYHRVPSFKRDIEVGLQDIVNATARMMYRKGKLPDPPDSIQQLIQEKGDNIFNAKISNWKLIEMMFEQAANSPISSILDSMNMAILEVEEDSSFLITSDTPVVLYDADFNLKPAYGCGFAHKSAEISFPLSSKTLLLFSHSDIPYSSLPCDLVHHFNLRMIVSAERFIYSQEPSANLLGDIHKLHNQQAGFTRSTLDYGDGAFFVTKTIPVTDSHLNKRD